MGPCNVWVNQKPVNNGGRRRSFPHTQRPSRSLIRPQGLIPCPTVARRMNGAGMEMVGKRARFLQVLFRPSLLTTSSFSLSATGEFPRDSWPTRAMRCYRLVPSGMGFCARREKAARREDIRNGSFPSQFKISATLDRPSADKLWPTRREGILRLDDRFWGVLSWLEPAVVGGQMLKIAAAFVRFVPSFTVGAFLSRVEFDPWPSPPPMCSSFLHSFSRLPCRVGCFIGGRRKNSFPLGCHLSLARERPLWHQHSSSRTVLDSFDFSSHSARVRATFFFNAPKSQHFFPA